MALRQQLTLFAEKNSVLEIEKIRQLYNPEQFALIAAHLTLCRDNELQNLGAILQRLANVSYPPITFSFGKIARTAYGHGAYLPATGSYKDYIGLRSLLLDMHVEKLPETLPHITLVHPRNGVCTEACLEAIEQAPLPKRITFTTVALIEQWHGGKWQTLKTYPLTGLSKKLQQK